MAGSWLMATYMIAIFVSSEAGQLFCGRFSRRGRPSAALGMPELFPLYIPKSGMFDFFDHEQLMNPDRGLTVKFGSYCGEPSTLAKLVGPGLVISWIGYW